MLRPPASFFLRIFRVTRSLISRSAVSGEHFVSLAHFEVVSLPSKPSSRRLMALRWRSLIAPPARVFQKCALVSTDSRSCPDEPSARLRQFKNHSIHDVMSNVPFGAETRIFAAQPAANKPPIHGIIMQSFGPCLKWHRPIVAEKTCRPSDMGRRFNQGST